MSGAYSEIFSGRGHQLSTIFLKVFFSGRINLKQIEKQERHDPQKIFEILYSEMAVLVFSEQFLGKFCLQVLPLTPINCRHYKTLSPINYCDELSSLVVPLSKTWAYLRTKISFFRDCGVHSNVTKGGQLPPL